MNADVWFARLTVVSLRVPVFEILDLVVESVPRVELIYIYIGTHNIIEIPYHFLPHHYRE